MRYLYLLCTLLLLGVPLGAIGQSLDSASCEATALQYFVATLLPHDHQRYHKIAYTGHVSPDASEEFPPLTYFACFSSPDSPRADQLGMRPLTLLRLPGRRVPLALSSSTKVVKRSTTKVPLLELYPVRSWNEQLVVPIRISVRYHYVDYYFIILNSTGQVKNSCRFATIQ
jgi:hypothetical protein